MSDADPAAHMAPVPVKAPVEAKVIASWGGSVAGVVLSAAVAGLLDDLVYTHGPVPDYLTGLVFLVCTSGPTWLAGWKTHHTPRPDLPLPEET